MKQPLYEWDETIGSAYCTIYYKNVEFKGVAICHENDEDMKSKLTGQIIAEMRATILLLQHIRDNEIKPQLQALKQFYYSINRSKHYNKKSYENKMLYRQIKKLEKDLQDVKLELSLTREDLKKYIDDKESIYQVIRDRRAKAENI